MCSRGWSYDVVVVEDAKATSEDVKRLAQDAFYDAEEKTGSLADWAQNKLSENFGSENDLREVARDIKYKGEDAASRTTDTLRSAASGASEYASQKVADAREAVADAMGYAKENAEMGYDGDGEIIRMPTDRETDAKVMMQEAMGNARERMADTYEDAKQAMYSASDKASNMAQNARDNMAESMSYGRDRAGDAYEEGKQKMSMASDIMSEKFYDAKESMAGAMEYASEKANNAYDGSRERVKMASQRTFDLKDKVKGAMEYGRDKAGDVYDGAKEQMEYGRQNMAESFDQAKQEVGEAYNSAKNTMSREAKDRYEAAKERVSDAAGNLGASMRNNQYL
ncbi:hypothetical protein PIB30_007166 [Stylosanthes scabra]|uniref:Uncharacterized protein n=1 Tax=Stylosanthes scabra TaxID=79078 RepID=A0ABU6U6L3_9FABA|nr:hypothetical protein [Stylosanthes scabra]